MTLDDIIANYFSLITNNKTKLLEENSCCYCLRNNITKDSIKEWTDWQQTAICPHCSIDSIIPGVIDKAVLAKVSEYYFSIINIKDLPDDY